MRQKLKEIDGERKTFTAIFVKMGSKKGYKGKTEMTLMLKNVKDSDGNIITDHLWFNYTKGFEKLGELYQGDLIQFDARVKEYNKGYINKKASIDQSKKDYRLSHPNNISKIVS